MKRETKKWRRFAQVTMENSARTYFENRLLYIGSKLRVSSVRLETFQERLNQVSMVLDGKDMNAYGKTWFDENGNFIAPLNLPLSKESEQLVESCNTMEQVVADLKKQYLEDKQVASQRKTREERHTDFTNILDLAFAKQTSARCSTEASKFYWHPPHIKGTQLKFNCLVLDERYSPGVILRRWYSKTEKQESVDPQAITAFIDYLAKYLINHYTLDDKYTRTLILFLDRLIFPRIKCKDKKPLSISQRTDVEKKADELFYKKSCWLRLCTQDQMGIKKIFVKRM
eukprot:UN24818